VELLVVTQLDIQKVLVVVVLVDIAQMLLVKLQAAVALLNPIFYLRLAQTTQSQ
jgi:hypothetical protein